MKNWEKLTALFAVVALILCSVNVMELSEITEDGDEELKANDQTAFCVAVTDEDGNKIEGADIYLYSFFDDGIVASGATDMQGNCTLTYMPILKLDDDEDMSTVYRDYLIYIQKAGYASFSHNTTRYYGPEDKPEMNLEFKLSDDVAMLADTAEYSQEMSQAVEKEKTIHGEQPFYVIRGVAVEVSRNGM